MVHNFLFQLLNVNGTKAVENGVKEGVKVKDDVNHSAILHPDADESDIKEKQLSTSKVGEGGRGEGGGGGRGEERGREMMVVVKMTGIFVPSSSMVYTR